MRMKKTAAATLVAASVIVAPQAASAQGLMDVGKFLLGIPSEEKAPIDYRERAPLVVPPSQNLRPPSEAAAPDQRRANWPQDPDVAARRQAAEDARKPVFVDSITGRDAQPTRRMTPAEVRAGRVAGQEVNAVPRTNIDERSGNTNNVLLGVTGLREMDRRTAASADRSGNLSREEPKREFLTDPPSGTRRPADNAAFRATREGSLGAREQPSPYDIFRGDNRNTR
jgi:hypothetical protein